MTTVDNVRAWIDGYLRAWASNDPDDIRTLFTEDAVYSGRPHDPEAWRGREGIVAGWLEHRDEPANWSFEYELLAVDGDRAFVQAVTLYADGPDYDNLWIVTFDGDRASEITEWYALAAQLHSRSWYSRTSNLAVTCLPVWAPVTTMMYSPGAAGAVNVSLESAGCRAI